MSCCANCNCNGLGAPYSTGDYVVAGSKIEWGGYVRDMIGGSHWDETVEANVKSALWNSGGFSWVDAGQIAGLLNQYVSIVVTTKVDFAHLVDVLRVIEGAIYQAGLRPETQSFWVASVPASAANRTDIATAGSGGSTNPGPQTQTPASGDGFNFNFCQTFPSLCGGSSDDSRSMLDKFASFLGVGTAAAIGIGVGGTLLALAAIKRVF